MLGLNKYAIYGIIAAIVIALGSVAIYQWRADIKQVAYDKIFREMAENELNEKQKEINRLTKLNEAREKAIADAIKERDEAQKAAVKLTNYIRTQTYSKEPVSQGLTRALDAIQDYGSPVVPQNSGGQK